MILNQIFYVYPYYLSHRYQIQFSRIGLIYSQHFLIQNWRERNFVHFKSNRLKLRHFSWSNCSTKFYDQACFIYTWQHGFFVCLYFVSGGFQNGYDNVFFLTFAIILYFAALNNLLLFAVAVAHALSGFLWKTVKASLQTQNRSFQKRFLNLNLCRVWLPFSTLIFNIWGYHQKIPPTRKS